MRKVSCPTFDDFAQCVMDSYARLYHDEANYEVVCVVAPYGQIAYILKSLLGTNCFIPQYLAFDYETIWEEHDEFVITIDKDGLLSVEPAFRAKRNTNTNSYDVAYLGVEQDAMVYIHDDVNSKFMFRNNGCQFVDFDIDEEEDIEDFLKKTRLC